jgi:UDP-N-acetyl-D-glucosamine dehydrogenase
VAWRDDVVGSWHGEKSAALGGADIAIVVTHHDVVNKAAVLASESYVFDTTGKLASKCIEQERNFQLRTRHRGGYFY